MKNSKILGYGLGLLVLGTLGYHSVYFKPLDQVRAGKEKFDPVKYAETLWTEKLLPGADSAVEAKILWPLFKSDKDRAFDAYSNAIGIGNVRYFLIRGKSKVVSVEEDRVLVKLEETEDQPQISIATEFVFGNAVRDASRAVEMNAFANSMDFNNVSAEINQIIRDRVIPLFRKKVKVGDEINFTGAIELNREHLDLNHVELIPVKLEISGQ